MIITEYYGTRPDGVRLEKTYSNQDVMIRNTVTNATYEYVINPENINRIYEETNIKIDHGQCPDNFDNSVEYLILTHLIDIANTENDPDYLNEHESEINYFKE